MGLGKEDCSKLLGTADPISGTVALGAAGATDCISGTNPDPDKLV
jgi:hypothetical protein